MNTKPIKLLLTVLIILSATTSINAQYFGGAFMFEGNHWYTTAKDIMVDADSAFYIVGEVKTPCDFDPDTGFVSPPGYGDFDIYITKYNKYDGLEWVKLVGGTSAEFVESMVGTPTGDVVFTGRNVLKMDMDPGPDVYEVGTVGPSDAFVIKLDKNGNFVWGKGFGGLNEVWSESVTSDDSGNVYVCGYFKGTVDFDPDSSSTFDITSKGGNDAFIVKLDPDGNLVWAKSLTGLNGVYAKSIQYDGMGNVVLTGQFWDTADFDPGAATHSIISVGMSDGFVMSLTTDGEFNWANSITGPDLIEGKFIDVDLNGNILAVGDFEDSIETDPGSGSTILRSKAKVDAYCIKYDNSGNLKWARSFECTDNVRAHQVDIDIYGDVHVCGVFLKILDFDPGSVIDTSTAQATDGYIIKMDSMGRFIDGWQIGGSKSDYYEAIIAGPDKFIYNVGRFTEDSVDFDPGSGTFYMDPTLGAVFASRVSGCSAVVTMDTTITVTSDSVYSNESGMVSYQWFDCSTGLHLSGETSRAFRPLSTGSYGVIIYNSRCIDTSGCRTVTVVGMESIGVNGIEFYPNPTTGSINFELGSYHKEVEIKIIDLLGRIRSNYQFEDIKSGSLALPSQPGVYIAEISLNGEPVGSLKLIRK